MVKRDSPPPWFTRVLARLLPETERDAILGDLAEEYQARRAAGEPAGTARRWYRRQAVAAARMTLSPTSGYDLTPTRIFAMGDLLHEVRYALRQLRRRPLHTAVVVLTLALGIGATSAVLSVANPILFRPLPYPEPDRVVSLSEVERDGSGSRMGWMTFRDIQRQTPSLQYTAVAGYWTPVLMGGEAAERLMGQRVTHDYFKVLGVRMLHGRDFRPEEDLPGQTRVAVLSYGLWQRRFGGDPAALNSTFTLSGVPFQVVGILPRDFASLYPPGIEIFRPLGYDQAHNSACRTCRHLAPIARLGPGIPLERAQAELNRVAERLVAEHPTSYSIAGIRPEPLQDRITAEVRPAVRLMLGAALFVLLIACANVGNLALARTAERSEELVVRAALGAGRWRLVRQLITENVLLCAAGAGAGLLLALWGVGALRALSPVDLPRLADIRLDWRVVLATLVATLGVALVTGVLPGLMALAGGRRHLRPAGGRSVTQARGHRRATAVLVVGEVALAFMLLAGAGLLTRSLGRVLAIDPGFDADNLLTMQIVAAGPRYDEDESTWSMHARLLDAVRAVPGVTDATLASQLPLAGNFDRSGIRIEDQPLANPEEAPSGDRYSVSTDYLETMGIPVLRGRGLTPEDRAGSAPVVLINETLARLRWPNGDPIGKRLQMGASDSPWRTIIGVVGDVRHVDIDAELTPQFYLPDEQWPWAANPFGVAVRTSGDPRTSVAAVRAAIHSVDPDLAIGDVASAEELVATVTADRRLVMRLFEAFAGVALLLAAAGIYGLLSRRVAERRREMGIRTALGASRRRILRIVLRDGGRLALTGVAIGLLGALALGRLLETLLYGLAPEDPATLAATVALLALTAVMACLLPAWRAAQVDPITALREQ